MMNNPKIICFGEILWDVFPDKKVIGGAPLNVALRLHSQNISVSIISKLGNDASGQNALKYLNEEEFSTNGIQKDHTLKTGEVLVTLDQKGSASYTISQPVAWDGIEFNRDAQSLVENAEVFVFGSLACRERKSKETLFELLKLAKFSVFDVNLRPPFYTIEVIVQLLKKADFVKMNDDELQEIASTLNCPYTNLEETSEWFIKEMKLKGICITKGEKGAFLIFNNTTYHHPGYEVVVKDTVGAGDSFLATLIGGLFINKEHSQTVLTRACAVGSLVASKAGANCKLEDDELNALISKTKK